MIYVDLLSATFNMTLTLGDADTASPPPLAFVFDRKGTNFGALFDLSGATIIPGNKFIEIQDLPTAIFNDPSGELQSGQYSYTIFDITTPSDPIELERGLLIGLTTPITKEQYGTDKKRGEYKGHL
jgi:hypothetical protein